MNIREFHTEGKPVSAKVAFKGRNAKVLAIHLNENGLFKKHTTEIPALLVCVFGSIKYEDENSNVHKLSSGDFIEIIPNVVHWLVGLKQSELLLIK